MATVESLRLDFTEKVNKGRPIGMYMVMTKEDKKIFSAGFRALFVRMYEIIEQIESGALTQEQADSEMTQFAHDLGVAHLLKEDDDDEKN